MLATRLHQFLLTRPYTSTAGRLSLALGHRLRRRLVRRGNPTVPCRIGDAVLQLPIGHNFPYDRKYFHEYSTSIGYLAAEASKKYPDLHVVDIGANVGDTAALVRCQSEAPVLCIEGSETYYPLLEQNTKQLAGVTLARSYVGEETGTSAYTAVDQDGTSRLAPSADDTSPTQLHRLGDILDQHPEFRAAKILKSDTDGFEGKILRGAKAWLSEARPIVHVEYSPVLLEAQGDNGLAILSDLRSLGYREAVVHEEMGALVGGLSLDDTAALSSMHELFHGSDGRPYCDLTLFHESDRDLFDSFLESETKRFSRRHDASTPYPNPCG